MKKRDKKYYVKAYTAEEKEKALKLLRNCSYEFVAHRYHCSVRTLYRWRKMYNGTLESLKPKYCAPYTPHPNRHTMEEIKHIKDLIKRNPHIGLNELYGKLRLNYAYNRHPSSLFHVIVMLEILKKIDDIINIRLLTKQLVRDLYTLIKSSAHNQRLIL